MGLNNLSRREFLRLCSKLSAAGIGMGIWPYASLAKSATTKTAIIGTYSIEDDNPDNQAGLFAGLGETGQRIVKQIQPGPIGTIGLLDDSYLVEPSLPESTSLPIKVEVDASTVQLVYNPEEISVQTARSLITNANKLTLLHHIHLTRSNSAGITPEHSNEAVTIIQNQNIEQIFNQNRQNNMFSSPYAVAEWLISQCIRMSHPRMANRPKKLRYMGCSYDHFSDYPSLIDNGISWIRHGMQPEMSRCINYAIGGGKSIFNIDTFNEATCHVLKFIHEDSDHCLSFITQEQIDDSRWVIITAQSTDNRNDSGREAEFKSIWQSIKAHRRTTQGHTFRYRKPWRERC